MYWLGFLWGLAAIDCIFRANGLLLSVVALKAMFLSPFHGDLGTSFLHIARCWRWGGFAEDLFWLLA